MIGNFVVNPVGQPRSALKDLHRVTRPGGRTAVTIWATPAAAGQTLLGRAVLARDEQGLAGPGPPFGTSPAGPCCGTAGRLPRHGGAARSPVSPPSGRSRASRATSTRGALSSPTLTACSLLPHATLMATGTPGLSGHLSTSGTRAPLRLARARTGRPGPIRRDPKETAQVPPRTGGPAPPVASPPCATTTSTSSPTAPTAATASRCSPKPIR
ncbi:hypothetical protein [Streptomyces virginiae]